MSCLFCDIVAGTIESKRVREDEHCVAFDDVNPQAPTHVLVVPREHLSTINEVSSRHESLVGRMVTMAKEIAAERGHQDDGYRLVFNCQAGAGQSVFHIHLHLLAGRSFSWPPG